MRGRAMNASRLAQKRSLHHHIDEMWLKNSGDDQALGALSVFHPTQAMLFTSKRQKFGELIFPATITHAMIGVILSPNSKLTLLNKPKYRIGVAMPLGYKRSTVTIKNSSNN